MTETKNPANNFNSVLIRIFFATLLVMFTYNPTTYSYYHWVIYSIENFDVLVVVAGVVLLIGWSIFLRATLRSLGAFGLALAFALCGTLLWLIIDWGLVSIENISAVTWIVLVIISLILGIGMSWSFIRRRMSGQIDTNDSDEE